jgi:hypothetical protein
MYYSTYCTMQPIIKVQAENAVNHLCYIFNKHPNFALYSKQITNLKAKFYSPFIKMEYLKQGNKFAFCVCERERERERC